MPGQVHSVCATRYACRTGSGEPAVTSSAGTSGPGERLALLAEQRIRAAAGLGRPAEKRLGADDPTTTAAHSVHNLSHVLHDQGDLDHARTLHQRAVSIREARPGRPPDTAQSLNNLATVLADQGDLQRARPLYERALRIREARLGVDHPDTVRSRERLAAVVAALENRQ